MKYPGETEMDCLMVHQKNLIIKMINEGNPQGAWSALHVVKEVWERIGYGYKVKELEERIESAFDTASD